MRLLLSTPLKHVKDPGGIVLNQSQENSIYETYDLPIYVTHKSFLVCQKRAFLSLNKSVAVLLCDCDVCCVFMFGIVQARGLKMF